MTKDDLIEFGRPLREKYFSQVDSDVYLVNNGANGLAPKNILDSFQSHILRDYSWPDRYRKYDYREDYDGAAEEVAKILGTTIENIALGANVTTLINAVLRSYPFVKGDKILVQSNSYPAILKTVKFVIKQHELELVELPLNYPLSDDEVVEKYEEVFKNNNIKLALIDTISSKPGVKLPYERLIKLASKYNVLSLVDAAHGIGLLDLNLDELQPDFLASDLYKWYYTPRGSALLYVNPKHHKSIHTLPISHFYVDGEEELPKDKEKTRFSDQFNYTGAQLIGALVTVKDASKFIEEIGGLQRIKDYNFKLAKQVGEEVSKLWKTQVLENKEGSLVSSLVSVEYPIKEGTIINESDWETFNIYKLIREGIEKKLIKEFNTTAPIFYHNGKIWIRFSAQIYSGLDDYIESAKLIEKGVDEYLSSNTYKKIIGAATD
ncbi:hypothetical protein BN7_2247 [Wickerhamomyces ciferrii]|uniref:Aminotransferase class V domain-containing protein n=1 Tax=Wickerhamomyces ciferrii (strain ATCC 14091 / BCRC 22168 / CBS 111 / JCM 3599 / NBRC 0793 / NRRL Y-1031 F-60-10) TaxID=1206466 RepID=K0KNK6_WICCF|nr:uncharacterized protein BN7_2247 [Wickerhamomyces ciferrii]CCH42703.1 hypothetical protein BN7_2247 [Wickerhamomyces ciferrii]